jgi:ribonucleoside-triphosphate reductase (thioredoxin)
MDHVRKAMSEFNFTSKYARYVEGLGRRETWEEACDRLLKMHMTRYADAGQEAREALHAASVAERSQRVLSSQRARQFGGEPILAKNWRIYNCVTSYCDRAEFFAEAFWLLLCGCGVGFSIQTHHIAKLPPPLPLDMWAELHEEVYVVPDTIEGWADSVRELISSRLGMRGSRPRFDFSKIRERGAPLSVGGKAPGSQPLSTCLDNISALLERVGDRLTSVDCFDIVMFTSDAVLSGGVRRAASIALFSADDAGMTTAKTGEWWRDNPQRARANISAVITPDVPREVFHDLFSSTREFGEPGFIFAKSREFVYNPCVEIGMVPLLITDPMGDVVQTYTLDMLEDRDWYESEGFVYESGWQACNLVEVNCSKFTDKGDALDAVRHATVLATAQAGYTESDYLKPCSRKILERESLIGVSLTGMANAPHIAFDPEWQRSAADTVKRTNSRIANMLGLRAATRTTCVKPSGNAAVLLGCASGIHPEYAKRYIRNIQVSSSSPVAKYFKDAMPDAVNRSHWGAEGSEDWVISFPLSNDGEAVYRKGLGAEKFLELVLRTQSNWVRHGTAACGVEGLTHNVSNTILVGNEEWGDIATALWDNRGELAGVSLLPACGDYIYEQPPFQEIEDPEDVSEDDPHRDKKLEAYALWRHLRDTWSSPDYRELRELDDATQFLIEAACAGGACEWG